MREHHGIDLFDWARKRSVLHLRFAAMSLKQSAVEEHSLAVDTDDVTRARDFACGAGKLYFHVVSVQVSLAQSAES